MCPPQKWGCRVRSACNPGESGADAPGVPTCLQREVILRDLQINELTISVSDMKGKFIKPSLKKVSKYENKFAKLQEKAAKFAFANQLKAK